MTRLDDCNSHSRIQRDDPRYSESNDCGMEFDMELLEEEHRRHESTVDFFSRRKYRNHTNQSVASQS